MKKIGKLELVGKLAIPLFILLGLCMASMGMTAATPLVSIEPASTTNLSQGDSFSVNISIDPAGIGVSGVDIKYLTFNPAVVSVPDGGSVIGDFLGADPVTAKNVVDNTNGTIWYGVASTTGEHTTPGTFATVNFTVKSDAPNGTYNLDLTKVELGNASGPITPIEVTNGTFTVGVPPEVPSVSIEPASTTNLSQDDSFSVNISIDPAGIGVSGVDIKYLTFNPAVVSVPDGGSVIGDFLGADPVTAKNVVDNTNGTIWYGVASTTGEHTTPGTLATVNFTVKSDAPNGTYNLDLTTVELGNVSGPITPIEVNDGTFTVVGVPPAEVAINELLPDPIGSDAEGEFIELYNYGDTSANITGWTLEDAYGATRSHTITGTIGAGEFMLFWRNETGITLNNGEDMIYLNNSAGTIVNSYHYTSSTRGKSWARIPDGTGNFEKADPTPGETNKREGAPNITDFSPTNTTPTNVEGKPRTFSVTVNQTVNVSWQINGTEVQTNKSVTEASYTNTSAVAGVWNVSAIASNANGTDMQTWTWDVTPAPVVGVVINEFIAGPATLEYPSDEIELYNPTDAEVNLTGWTISSPPSSVDVASLDGMTIPAGGYLTLKEAYEFGFKLAYDGDMIVLKNGTTIVDQVTFGNYDDGNVADNAPAPGKDNSTGRDPNGVDTDNDGDDFRVFTTPTIGANNTPAEATTGDINVNEIMYNPSGAIGSDADMEWVELYNNDTAAINMSDWTLDGSAISPSTTMQPGDYLIIARNKTAFESYYTNVTCTIIDMSSLSLTNTEDTIVLSNSTAVEMDNVTYTSSLGADGNGKTLELNATGGWEESTVDGGTPSEENSVIGVVPVLTTITVEPPTANLTVNNTRVFTATAYDQDGKVMEGINITWTSSNETVGTVSPTSAITGPDGNATTTFTALANGTTTVTATNGTVNGTAEVTVIPGLPKNGDINGNGTVNMDDAVYLVKYLYHVPGFAKLHANGDINSDGTVNMDDAVYLVKHLYHVPGYEDLYPGDP